MGGSQASTASPLPLWWSRQFLGEPLEVSKARSWVAGLLPPCEPLDDLLIFASELATNAVTHTRSGEPKGWFTVEVTWSLMTARVVVGDQGSDDVPTSKASPGDDPQDLESGRGLQLIDAMSADWGTVGDATARWLWADVKWRSRGGPPPTTPGGNSSAQQFAALSQAYPGATAWYDSHSGQWYATLPGVAADGTVSAPSPAALAYLMAARYPRTIDAAHLMAAVRTPRAAIPQRAAQHRTS
jgi:serine/threonine-protein kinase RsbW